MWRFLWNFLFLRIQILQLRKINPSAPALMLSLCHFPFHSISPICSAWCVPSELFTAQTIFGFLHHLLEKLLQPAPFLHKLLQHKQLWSVRGEARSICVGGPKVPYLIHNQINTSWWSLCIHYTTCIWHTVVAILWQPAVPSWGSLLWAAMSGLLHVRAPTQHKHVSPFVAVDFRWGGGCCMKNCPSRNQVEADKKSHCTSQYLLAY